VGDTELIWELTEAVRNDTDAPVLEQRFNPTDPIAIEIILHEADFAVERYMEKWKSQYRERFADPSAYDNFVLEFQMKVRKDVKAMIGAAQQFIADELEGEREEEEGDGYEEV
jgi:hypothetical protein